jgi:predicted lipoprotein with Yx(FWY)xxD motif
MYRSEVPHMRSRLLMVATVLVAGIALSACSSSPGSSAASGTVQAKSVGTIGTVLVAANGMTVYQFSKDVKGSGTSACAGGGATPSGCLLTWPAVTVPAGTTPTAGVGATGTLATITRADDGTLQVTYNGLPLYYFSGDKAVGDAHGVYTGWSSVTP